MKPLKIILCDSNEALPILWKKYIPQTTSKNNISVSIHHGQFDSLMASMKVNEKDARMSYAVVSPGNSLGYLGGGFDLALRNYFGGVSFESWFREQLGYGYHTVGSATVVDLSKCDLEITRKCRGNMKYIIHCPTMISPVKPIFDERNPIETGYQPVFNAMWNGLMHVPSDTDGLIIPGLCTGFAGVPPTISCKSTVFALRLYMLDGSISKELRNILILYFLGHSYESFFLDSCKEECKRLGISIDNIQKFDIQKNSLNDLLPARLGGGKWTST